MYSVHQVHALTEAAQLYESLGIFSPSCEPLTCEPTPRTNFTAIKLRYVYKSSHFTFPCGVYFQSMCCYPCYDCTESS